MRKTGNIVQSKIVMFLIFAGLTVAFEQELLALEITHTTAKLSQPRCRLAATTVGSLAMFAGGENANGSSNVVDIYNFQTGIWSTTSLSHAGGEVAAVTVGNKAMFAGGSGSNIVDVYDSMTNEWSVIYLPHTGIDISVAAVGDKVLFEQSTWNIEFIDIYNVNTNTWSSITLSTPRFNVAATATSTEAFFAGGNRGGTHFDTIDVYHADTNTWSLEKLSEPKTYVGATSVGDLAIFAGGCTTGPRNTVDVYDSSTGLWSYILMPGELGGPEGATVGQYAFFAGCWDTDAVQIYDTISKNWFTTKMSYRYELTATSVGNQAIFAGGQNRATPKDATDIVDIYTVIPEPATILLLGLGGLALLKKRRS